MEFRVRDLANQIILPTNKIILRKHSKAYDDMAAIDLSTSSSNRC